MKGLDQIVDPLLTKGSGSDLRSEKKRIVQISDNFGPIVLEKADLLFSFSLSGLTIFTLFVVNGQPPCNFI